MCDGCYAQLQRPTTAKTSTTRTAESDLPAEYLNSSLAQQVQVRYLACYCVFLYFTLPSVYVCTYVFCYYYSFILDPTP